jgi:hypothetical protein
MFSSSNTFCDHKPQLDIQCKYLSQCSTRIDAITWLCFFSLPTFLKEEIEHLKTRSGQEHQVAYCIIYSKTPNWFHVANLALNSRELSPVFKDACFVLDELGLTLRETGHFHGMSQMPWPGVAEGPSDAEDPVPGKGDGMADSEFLRPETRRRAVMTRQRRGQRVGAPQAVQAPTTDCVGSRHTGKLYLGRCCPVRSQTSRLVPTVDG